MDEKKKFELSDDHNPDYYAVNPPCVRCAYKFMVHGKPCPCCGASWEEQIGGF